MMKLGEAANRLSRLDVLGVAPAGESGLQRLVRSGPLGEWEAAQDGRPGGRRM